MSTPGGLVDKQELIDAQLDTAHLGRVVNSKDASGAPISTSTNRTGGVNKTLDALEAEYQADIDNFVQVSDQVITDKTAEFDTSIANKEAEADAAIDSYRLLNKGPYASGITLESKFEFITYNGESYFATNPPYTTTATTPDADVNLFVGGYVNESLATQIAETVLEENVSTYTDIVYKASGGNSAVENMVADLELNPVMHAVGTIIKTGGTTWVYEDSTGTITIDNFRAFNVVNAFDFGVKGDGISDDTAKLQEVMDKFDNVFLPPGLYVTSSPLTFSGNTELNGPTFMGNQGFGHWGTDVTLDDCISKQIVVIGNITTDVLVGNGRLNVNNVGFTGVLGSVAINSTKGITKATTGSMAVNLRGCAFTAFNTAVDNDQTSFSQYITECAFFLNGTGVSLTNDPFNVRVTKSKFTENNIGIDIGPGDSVKVTDNNFAITALKNQIGIRSTACTNVDFSRNYFEDYGTVPASDYGAYAYWIIFNGFQSPPWTVTLENNIMQMGGNSDSAIRLSQNNKGVLLPLDTKFNRNTYLSTRVSDIFVESDANIAIDLRDLTVTNRPVFHAHDYFCQFSSAGNLQEGYGLTCSKLGTGQYRVSRDSFTAGSPKLLGIATHFGTDAIFSATQGIQSTHVDVLFRNSSGVLTDTPFIINVREI